MSEYLDYIKDSFAGLGVVTAKRMFGGHGIYYDGTMIALVSDDMLYLKADAQTAPLFKEKELAQFAYQREGKMVALSYFQAPEEVLDDPAGMCEWAMLAYEAALRSRKP